MSIHQALSHESLIIEENGDDTTKSRDSRRNFAIYLAQRSAGLTALHVKKLLQVLVQVLEDKRELICFFV